MKFWKFEAPNETELNSTVEAGILPPAVTAPGQINTFEQILRRIKIGDGLVLASLIGEEGRIVAFGQISAIGSSPNEIRVRWAKKSHGVHPTGSGLEHWRTKTAFEISAIPARRYGLQGYIDFHLNRSK